MINRTSIAHQVVKVQMEELAAVSVGEPEFLDLKQPWLYAPR
ncbi:MAG: hypothetical protein ACJ745_07615 [Actinomycetes bacterium]